MAYIQNNPLGPAKKVGSTEDDSKAGGSNAGKYDASEGPFCGPSGGSPKGTYPIGSEKRGQSAIDLAHNAPKPEGIKACVYRKYPGLRKDGAAKTEGAARSKEKLEQIKSDMQTNRDDKTMGVKRYNQKIQRLNTKIARKS
tara:strand:+ start:2470 stop:2892 length:423 start_codon:yes stop_codon:yes gene_type:complete